MEYSGTKTAQPYISKIILENAADNQLKVIVRVALKGNSNSNLTDSMITNIVKVTDSDTIKRLAQNSIETNTQLIENAFQRGNFGELGLSAGEVKTLPKVAGESEKGFNIVTQEFFVNRDIVNLTFYIICQHDLEHPKYKKIASSKNFKKKVVNDASIVAEDVFRDGHVVATSKVFVHSDSGKVINKKRDWD